MKTVLLSVAFIFFSTLSQAAKLLEVFSDNQEPRIVSKFGEHIKSVMISNIWAGSKVDFAVLNIVTDQNTYFMKFTKVADAASVMQAIDQKSTVSVRDPQKDGTVGKVLVKEIMISKSLQ